MKRSILLLALLTANSWADCVLQDRTVTRTSLTVVERSEIRPEVFVLSNGSRRCSVAFKARVGNEWHSAYGEYEWPGDRPQAEACGVAVKRADDMVLQRVGDTQITNDKLLVCRDQPDFATISSTQKGTTGELHQFRPHPDYPNRFWHNGAQCKMFLDSQFNGHDVHTYQGVICQIQGGKWIVVDKF